MLVLAAFACVGAALIAELAVRLVAAPWVNRGAAASAAVADSAALPERPMVAALNFEPSLARLALAGRVRLAVAAMLPLAVSCAVPNETCSTAFRPLEALSELAACCVFVPTAVRLLAELRALTAC